MNSIWIVGALGFFLVGFTGSNPKPGMINGKFVPCPDSPNCVSTQAPDRKHAISPLAYRGSAKEAKNRLLNIIGSMKRAKVVNDEGNYVHAEFKTAVFRFVDDSEFFIDDSNKVIHMKSAARLGYYDFGVNRRRMEAIKEMFNSLQTIK